MEELSMEVDKIEDILSPKIISNPIEEKEDTIISEQHGFHYPPLFTGKTLLELSSSSWARSRKATDNIQPYLRGCKWSPDGTCCLSVVNNDGIHLTELPRDLYAGIPPLDRNIDILDSVIHVKESGLVYDFCWFPGMHSTIPESCCWITTKQNAPIQMWDAFDGSLRCSYRGFDATDEMEPALAVTFNVDGSRIIAGYKKVLRTFDVDRPGRDFAELKIASPATCFAVDSNLVAVGSWNSTINLYNISEMGTYKSIGKMHGHSGGVTHMKFSPDGLRLVSGARKDHRFLVWDIRYYRRPLNILTREVKTNQRVYFDISPCGNYLVSGGTDGILKVWDVTQINWKSSLEFTEEGTDNATYKFPLHNDCCNSVSIHPLRPILATGSGQYHFTRPDYMSDEESPIVKEENVIESVKENNSQNTSEKEVNSEIVKDVDTKLSSVSENSLVFWWIGQMLDGT